MSAFERVAQRAAAAGIAVTPADVSMIVTWFETERIETIRAACREQPSAAAAAPNRKGGE